MIAAIGTYLPVWGEAERRAPGSDEDVVTLAVAAGRAAMAAVQEPVRRVVLVSRGFPLVEGGNAAVLLGGLDVPSSTAVTEQLGGASAVLDALLDAAPGTLVLAADTDGPAGAGAAFVSTNGLELQLGVRSNRSLPVLTRDLSGNVHDYADPRLLRERGALGDLRRLHPKPDAVAGLSTKDARSVCAGDPPRLPTVGASSMVFALAALAGVSGGTVAAVDQASTTTAVLVQGDVSIRRDERAARPAPRATLTPGPEIPIALPAYDRAFDAKLRWQASTRLATGELDFPPRPQDAVRDDEGRVLLTPLPRTGAVYTTSTVHVPVPGKPTPYQLVIVQLEDGTRALAATTGSVAGEVAIDDRGEMVLRRVEVRSGVPDYGYAFRPDAASAPAQLSVTSSMVGEVPA